MPTRQMPFTARDPHHGGAMEWGWDGHKLWTRPVCGSKWTEVKRIHPTPKRTRTLAELMANKPWEHWAKDLL